LILYADEITFTLENVLFDVETPRGPVKVRVDPDHELRDDGGRTVAAFDYLLATFELHEVSHDMLVMAHNSESRESFRFFEIGWVIGFDSRLHLFDETRQERHRVTAVRVTGPFSWSQTPVDLRIESFTDVVFAHGKIALSGRDGHLVLTLQDGELRGPGALELRPSRPDQNIDGR
jgi:hypothetical protein